jgi:hypothetical protein
VMSSLYYRFEYKGRTPTRPNRRVATDDRPATNVGGGGGLGEGVRRERIVGVMHVSPPQIDKVTPPL